MKRRRTDIRQEGRAEAGPRKDIATTNNRDRVHRRTFLLASAGIAGAFFSGCGGDDNSQQSNPPNPPAPDLTKQERFENGFYDVQASGPFTPLPATTKPCVSYAPIRINQQLDVLYAFGLSTGYFHTRLFLSAANSETDVADPVTLEFFKLNGQPLSVTTKEHGTGESILIPLEKGQSTPVEFLSSAEEAGYVRVSHDSPTTGTSVTQEFQGASRMINSAVESRPVSQLVSAARVVVLDDEEQATGIDILNPGMNAIDVTYTLREANGTMVGTASRTVEAGENLSEYFFTVAEFSPNLMEEFAGTVEITTTGPATIRSMIHVATQLFPYIRAHPVTKTLEQQITYTDVPVTYGEKAFFELVTGDQDATYTFRFYNQDGTERTVKTEDHGTGSELTVLRPANTYHRLIPTTNDDGGGSAESQGYVVITTDDPDARADMFIARYPEEVSIEPAITATIQRIPVEGWPGRIEYALLNTGDEVVEVTLSLIDSNGTKQAGDSLILQPKEQKTGQLYQLEGISVVFDEDFSGMLNLFSTGPISANAKRDEKFTYSIRVLPTFLGGYDPELVHLLIAPYDLSLRKRLDQVEAMEGVPAPEGDGILTANGVPRRLPMSGVSLWMPPGAVVQLDMEHPDYWNDVLIARTDPDTWSTVGYKDADRELQVTVPKEWRGQSVELELHAIRDMEQLQYQLPLEEEGTYFTREHFLQMARGTRLSFLDPQNIRGYLEDYYTQEGGRQAEVELIYQIFREAVTYLKSLSPLTYVTIIENTPWPKTTGTISLVAGEAAAAGFHAGSNPCEIDKAVAEIASVADAPHQAAMARSEVFIAITAWDNYSIDGHGRPLGPFLYGMAINLIARNQEFHPVAKLHVMAGLNTDRGIRFPDQ